MKVRSEDQKCDGCEKPLHKDDGHALIGGVVLCLKCLKTGDRDAERIARGECPAHGTKLIEGVCEDCRKEGFIAP